MGGTRIGQPLGRWRRILSAGWWLMPLWLALGACSNHFLIHPRRPGAEVTVWRQQVERGNLRMRLQWAAPRTPGPHPAVLVHPEARHSAREMRGITRALARHGFISLAVDYEHIPTGDRIFTWMRKEDARAALAQLLAHPDVDPQRVATLGYSQGAVYSLLIAAETDQIAAVVAYYPVTDFELWFDDPRRPRHRRMAFRQIERLSERRLARLAEEEGGPSEFEHASPLQQVDRIRAPVLLIHGDEDTTVTLEHSKRLLAALADRQRVVRLFQVPGAAHVFNFRSRAQALAAWDETLAWLDRYLVAE